VSFHQQKPEIITILIYNGRPRFFDMTAKGRDREGYIAGGVNGNKPNGFTNNSNVHEPGNFNPHSILDNVQAYQSRYSLAFMFDFDPF
jgi:hypothetical protein